MKNTLTAGTLKGKKKEKRGFVTAAAVLIEREDIHGKKRVRKKNDGSEGCGFCSPGFKQEKKRVRNS